MTDIYRSSWGFRHQISFNRGGEKEKLNWMLHYSGPFHFRIQLVTLGKPRFIGCVVNYNCIVFVWFNYVIIHSPTTYIQTYTLHLRSSFQLVQWFKHKTIILKLLQNVFFCVTQKKTTILRWTVPINCTELSRRQTLFGSIDGCYFENHAIGTVIKLA